MREQILTAARAEFASFGFAGARIDRIARSAEASKERLYAHFGDKEALFREVVAMDSAEFFHTVSLRPEAVSEFAGEIFDLACEHPELLRMITWARLEGMPFAPPVRDDAPTPPEEAITAIKTAQQLGYVDAVWDPNQLLVMLFGLALSWAHWPDPEILTENAAEIDHRRQAVVRAASRMVAAGVARNR